MVCLVLRKGSKERERVMMESIGNYEKVKFVAKEKCAMEIISNQSFLFYYFSFL